MFFPQATDAAEVQNAVRIALRCGYRHIDTAQVYLNEAAIGEVPFSSQNLSVLGFLHCFEASSLLAP